MLYAPIIYIQGSAGNLVARCLTLDENTIPYLPSSLIDSALGTKYSTEQRFNFYNNWNHLDWKKTEDLEIKYHHPAGDTALVQLSPLKLICTFHPKQFFDGEAHGTWWKNPYWHKIIFITFEQNELEKIIYYGSKKKEGFGVETQVKKIELKYYEKLLETHKNSLKIKWSDIIVKEHFIDVIKDTCDKLDIKFYHNQVSMLWEKWYAETKRF